MFERNEPKRVCHGLIALYFHVGGASLLGRGYGHVVATIDDDVMPIRGAVIGCHGPHSAVDPQRRNHRPCES